MVLRNRKRAIGIGIMLVLTTFVGTTINVTGSGVPPVADAGGPYTGEECNSILLNAEGSYDPEGAPLTYRWYVEGSWVENYYNPYLEWIWLDDFSGEVTLEVSDGDLTATDTAQVTILNVPPVINSTNGPTDVELGTAVPLVVNFYDGLPDPRGLIASLDTYTATFYWDDGSFDVLSLGVEDFWANYSHLYTAPGVYTITITIVDDNGGEASTTWEVSVNEQLVDAGPDALIDEGSMFISNGLLADDSGTYTAQVDYGDGTGVQPLPLNEGNTFDLQHQYDDNGIYTVVVTVFNEGEEWGSDSAIVTVMNVPPTAILMNDGPKDEGSLVTVSFVDQYDPGMYDSFFYSFDWNNDGTYEIVDQVGASATYTWYDEGSYVVKGKIKDNDGGFTEYTTAVAVNNVAPTATLINNGPKAEGSLVTVSFINQYDPGSLDTFTYSFDWNNDGTYEIVDQVGVSAAHTWYDNGVFTVKGRIKDSDGGFTEYTTTVTVVNVAPTATLGNDGPKNEGSLLTVMFSGQYDPGASDTFRYSFDWNNDGTYEIVDQVGVSAGYTWYDNGVYTVKGKIKDNDGGFTVYTTAVTVNNVPPTITSLTGPPTNPVQLGNAIYLLGVFTDPGILDSHVALIEWGDGQTTTANLAAGVYLVNRSHTYTSVGVYMITLTVTDKDNGFDKKSIGSYVVIYDINSGFVTGGGWIIAPPGSYPANPTLSGRCNFGFVSKYKKGQSNPEGNTEFQFQVGNLNFHSQTYEWLVIAGPMAMYRGTGTINGAGNYGFIVTAIDGKILGGSSPDQFRIRIWDKNNNDLVVFDNLLTNLSGGQITIHK